MAIRFGGGHVSRWGRGSRSWTVRDRWRGAKASQRFWTRWWDQPRGDGLRLPGANGLEEGNQAGDERSLTPPRVRGSKTGGKQRLQGRDRRAIGVPMQEALRRL